MSSTSEVGSKPQHDKVQVVKWPYLESHWQTQQFEARQRTMKKLDRSHSWWWDSHNSPKNSKWLQENLSEMDLKVTAMLKIIEEDADSFSKRAEMFYKRRPELVNLVEEFYRTYRALVERYTFLTREIRQNVPPALRAQLGASADSALNSPVDAHLKLGLDGIDIISPSYSYTGGSEYDDDSPSEVSSRSWKAHIDEEEFSPRGFGSNFDIRFLGSKPKFPNLEEENSNNVYEPGGMPGAVVVDIKQLQKNLRNLQEENKALSAKALGDVTNLKNLHLELSSLQSKMKTLEAEDKLAKNRLKAVLEQEQKLEAENLKLSHALITAKEEKTGLAGLRKREMEENEARCRRIQQMEGEAVLLKEEILRAQSQALVGLEQVKKLEEENEKLQQAITSVQEEREKDSLDQRQAFELLVQELQERFSLLEKDNVRLKEQIATGAADTKRLEDQVMELMKAKRDLSQELHDVQKQNKALEHEKHRADLKSQKLQWELDVAQRDGQSLSEQMVQKTAQIENLQRAICELQAESTRLAIQKMEGSKQVIKLEAYIEELQMDRNRLIFECQQYEDKCKEFEVTESRFNEHLASKSAEYAVLWDQKSVNEALVTKAELQVKELQESLSTLYSEKAKLMHELEKALEQVKTIETCCAQMRTEIEESQQWIDKLKQELAVRTTHITDLEGTLSCLIQKKDNLEKREAEDRQAIIELQENSSKLGERLEAECAVTKRLKEQISDLQEERTALGVDIQQTQQRLVGLQGENVALSNQYEKSRADHQAAVKAATRGQEFLSLHLCEIKKLQDQNVANMELIHKMDNEIETLRKQLAKSEEENEIMGKDNENHLKKLADVEGRIRILEATQSDSLTENAALADQVSDKARAIEVLEVRLSDLERERANLMEKVALKSDRTLLLQAQLLASEQQGKSLHSELQNGADVIRSLEAEVKRMQQAVSKAEGDNKTLVEHRQRHVQESFFMEKKIKDLQEELSHITLEKIALVGEVTISTEQCKDLELRIQSLKVDKDAVQKELSAVVLLENQLKEEVRNLHEDNKQLSCALDAEHKQVQKQEQDLQKLQQTLNSSQEKRKVIQDILNAASEEKDVLERKCGDMQSEMQAQLLASKKQEESLHTQLQNGVDVIRSLEAELKGLQQAISTAEGHHKTMVQERQRSMDEGFLMEKKIKDLQEELSHVTLEKVALVGEVATSTEQCKDLDVRIRSLKVDKDAMQKEFSATLLLKEQVQEENERLSGTIDAEMRKVQKQEEDLQKLQQTLISSQEECKAIRDRLKVASEEKDVLERKCGDVQSKMQAQLLASEKQEESLYTRLQNGDDVIRSLEAELNRLQQAISKAEGDNKTMVQERQISMNEGFLTEKKIKDLQEELRHLTQERVAHAREVTTSTDQCKDLEQKIQSLQVDKDAVQKELSAVVLLENQLKEEARKVQEENNQLSSTLEAEIIKVQKQEEDLQKLQQTLISSQEECMAIRDRLKVASEEKDVLERKCGDLQSKMQAQLLASEKQEESLHTQLQNGDNVIRSLEAEVNRLQQAISKAEGDNKSMVQERQRSMDEGFLTEKKITDLQEELRHLTQERVALAREVTTSTDQCKDLERRIQSLQVDKDAVQKELSAVVLLENQLKEEVRKVQEENNQLSSTLEAEILKVQKQEEDLQKLQQTLSSSQEERKEVQDKLKVALEEKDDSERKYIGLQEELEENKRAALAATDSLQKLEGKFGRVQQAIAVDEANLSTKAKVISTLEEDALKLQNKIKYLEEETERLRQALNDMQRENEGLGEQSSKSAADLKDAQTASVYVREELDKQIALGIKLQEEVKSLTEENRGLSQTVSTAATESLQLKDNLGELQQQSDKTSQRHSILQSEKRELVDAMELLKARVKDLEVLIGGLENTKQALLMQHDKDVWQMMLDIKDLQQVLDNRKNNLTGSRGVSGVNTKVVLSDEELLEERKKEDLRRQAEQTQASGFASIGSVTSDTKAVPTSTNLPTLSNSQDESVLDMADNKILEGSVCSSDERERFAAVAAMKDEIAKLSKEICNVLEESDVLRSESLAAWMQHHLIGIRANELEEKLSSQQRENVRLSWEVDSFKIEISRLEEETAILKGENGGLDDKVSAADVEVRKLQGMLSSLQEEGSRFVISLKVKLFSLQEEIMLATEEWKNGIGKEEGSHIEQTHTSEITHYEEGLTRVEDNSFQQGKEEKSSAENLGRRSVEEELLPQYWTVQLILAQLQVRVEEADTVLGAVKILRQIIAKFCQKQREEPGKRSAPSVEEQQHETISVEDVGPQRLHFNLGTRLQYEEMDEQLEHEVRELKQCQKHLREELEARVDQARRLQTEVEQGGKEEVNGGAERKHKKEKLVEKVRQQRQRVEEVTSGAAVQEAAAERLEEQVLAKKESATMEGWKEGEVNRLRREMGSIVELNRKQALELQSVDEELQSLESSLIITPRHAPTTTSPLEEETEQQQKTTTPEVEQQDKRNSSGRMSNARPLRFRSLRPQKSQSIRRTSESSGASSPADVAPIRSSSSNMAALFRVEQLRDKAACWACVSPPPSMLASLDD